MVINAVFGVNRLLITYPAIVKEQFPSHVVNATAYGRLASNTRMINVDFSLNHDDEVRCHRTITHSFVRSHQSINATNQMRVCLID